MEGRFGVFKWMVIKIILLKKYLLYVFLFRIYFIWIWFLLHFIFLKLISFWITLTTIYSTFLIPSKTAKVYEANLAYLLYIKLSKSNTKYCTGFRIKLKLSVLFCHSNIQVLASLYTGQHEGENYRSRRVVLLIMLD